MEDRKRQDQLVEYVPVPLPLPVPDSNYFNFRRIFFRNIGQGQGHIFNLLILSLAILFCFSSLQGNPWGKDADLARNTFTSQSAVVQEHSRALYEKLIRFHQEVISPADGPRSHFLPSSSQYTLDAMRHFGFFKGFILGCDRLMRENSDPWVYRKTVDEQNKMIKSDPLRP